MKIQWQKDVELSCVDEYDVAHDKVDGFTEIFKKDEIIDIDIVSTYVNAVDVQFGDGSVCFAIPKIWFKKL